MELGQKLKQARLEAGLSQRQLCADTITRNMLSQIENGSAKPSFATLQVLSARLGKPISYFWEEAPSENLALLHKARQAEPAQAIALLQQYLSPDPMLDEWYHLQFCQCAMALAEQALQENRAEYARSLLLQAEDHQKQATQLGALCRRQLLLLQYKAGVADARSLVNSLPDNTEEMRLRAGAALSDGNAELCLACLGAADRQTAEILLLRGDALMQKQAYTDAADCFHALEAPLPAQVYPRLEACYRELGDYKQAYTYACKQR